MTCTVRPKIFTGPPLLPYFQYRSFPVWNEVCFTGAAPVSGAWIPIVIEVDVTPVLSPGPVGCWAALLPPPVLDDPPPVLDEPPPEVKLDPPPELLPPAEGPVPVAPPPSDPPVVVVPPVPAVDPVPPVPLVESPPPAWPAATPFACTYLYWPQDTVRLRRAMAARATRDRLTVDRVRGAVVLIVYASSSGSGTVPASPRRGLGSACPPTPRRGVPSRRRCGGGWRRSRRPGAVHRRAPGPPAGWPTARAPRSGSATR